MVVSLDKTLVPSHSLRDKGTKGQHRKKGTEGKHKNKGKKEQRNKVKKEQRNKGTKEQRNKGTKKQKVHTIWSGTTRYPGLVFFVYQIFLYSTFPFINTLLLKSKERFC